MMPSLVSLYIVILAVSRGTISALSTPPSRPFIEFTNPLARVDDRLPASFVSTWPTWVLDCQTKRWQKIPDDGGFVPPTSLRELWQPSDLIDPTCRLAVGLHVRDGTIRHILPALDLTLGGEHRNRGLCSVPRAHRWMDFGAALAGGLNAVSLSLQTRVAAADDDQWETLAEIDSIEETVTAAIEALADDPPEELGDGSTVVHVLVCSKENPSLVCPRPGSELRVLLLEDGVTFGTLQVSVEKTAPGSESEYLPEAYRALFEDQALRRPAFVETMKRLEMRTANKNRKE